MKSAIIVGGGMCGCAVAHLLKEEGWEITLFEKENHLGGGCRTLFYGGHPYTIGPRPLYTPFKKVFDFLSKFVDLRTFELYLDTFVEKDKQFYSYPIHVDDIPGMPDAEKIKEELKNRSRITESMNFEEYYIASIGRSLYEKFVDSYSKKMWGIKSNVELTDFKWSLKGVALKEGSRRVRDDLITGHPTNMDGYNRLFESAKERIDHLYLNAFIEKFDPEKRAVYFDGEWRKADILVSTTFIDLLMDYRYGELPYIGRDFIKFVLPVEKAIPGREMFLYYAGDEPFTRIVEYKKLYGYESPSTLLGIEIPSFNNKLYPYPIKKERERAEKYLKDLPNKVFSLGRMGRYVYDNIGEVIMQAHELVEKLK